MKLKKKKKGILKKSAKKRTVLSFKKTTPLSPFRFGPLIFRSLKKITVALLIVGINWSGLAAVMETDAYFNDTENSAANVFSAGALDILLNPPGVYTSPLLYPGDTASTSVDLSNGGTLPYQYTARADILDGEEACVYFTMAVTTDGTYSYSGAIGDFASPASASSEPDDWDFTFSLSLFAPPEVWGRSCFFKWVFSAWQADLPGPAGGFSDTEEKLGSVRIGKAVVLNEFLPNPLGSDNAPKPGGEWVELYNNSSVSFDLDGWYIYDSTDNGEVPIDAGHTIGGTVIPAHGFLVVYRDGDSDFILNNDADSVRLFTDRISEGGVLLDSYTYAMEKLEGFSYARIPDGVGDWVDPIPTPGRPNVFSENGIILEEGAIENIASLSFSETLELAAGSTSEFVINNSGQIASESQEMVDGKEAAAASGSFEIVASPSVPLKPTAVDNSLPLTGQAEPEVAPMPELSEPSAPPEAALEVSPEITPEPAVTPESVATPEPSSGLLLTPESTDPAVPSSGGASLAPEEQEPAIPVEPVTVEQPAEPAPPPADPPPAPAE